MNLEKEVFDIFERQLGQEVKTITDCSKGVEQIVKVVNTDVNNYVIKFPREGKAPTSHREAFVWEKLKGRGPIPEVVLSTDEYIVQKFIDGEDLSELNLDEDLIKNVYKKLGEFLKVLHSVKMSGFGFVDKNGKGESITLKEKLDQYNRKDIVYISMHGVLKDGEILRIIKYLSKNNHLASLSESVLLHFDFEDWNIRVKDGELSGVIDFGDLFAGPSSFEFARPFISGYEDNRFEYLLEGYGDVDKKEIEYFVVVTLLWLIRRHHRLENTVKLERDLKILRSIV